MRGLDIPRAMGRSRVVIKGLSETLYSRVLDRFASTSLPPFVMEPFLRAYCRLYDVDVDTLSSPFGSYRNFREFFVRPVRAGVRHIATDPGRLTSPVDGLVLATGTFGDAPPGTMRIKGRLYTIGDLLGVDDLPAGFRSGGFILFYLAPGNYHRFHCPMDGAVTGYDYLPGSCMPVNRLGRLMFPHVYVTNRRVILWLTSSDDPPLEACLVLIGAMGVGRILVNAGRHRVEGSGEVERHVRFDAPVALGRGDELGCFDLGSSAILIWSSEVYRPSLVATEGPVKLGEPVVALGRRPQGEPDA